MQRATPAVDIAHIRPGEVGDEVVARGILTEQRVGPAHGEERLLIVVVLWAEEVLVVVEQMILTTVDDLVAE